MNKWILLLVVLAIPLLGLSCSKNTDKEGSSFFGNILGDAFSRLEKSRETTGNFIGNAGTNFLRGLNDKKKKIVDEWLEINLLNNFGDPIDTVYASGIPTFDKNNGEIEDRFEYLFKKFPELKNIILQKLEIEEQEIDGEYK